MSLCKLISTLKNSDNVYQKLDIDFKALILVLEKLNSMIGLENVKNKIARSVMCILVSKISGNLEKECYNFMITGPPGVGKTELGTILAEIFAITGITKNKETINNKSIQGKEDHIGWWLIFMMHQLEETSFELWQNGYEDESVSTRINWIYKACLDLLVEVTPKMDHNLNSNTSDDKLKTNDDKLKTRDKITKSPNVKITYLTREELCGRYQGHTAKDTAAILETGKGGVFIFDEAYSIINDADGGDSFGNEALNVINRLMLDGESVFGFMGYRKEIEERVFKVQPGLKSRFRWIFDIPGYTNTELAQIFMSKVKFPIEFDEKFLVDTIGKNLDLFKFFGRDIGKLYSEAKDIMKIRCFYENSSELVLKQEDLLGAVEELRILVPKEYNNFESIYS